MRTLSRVLPFCCLAAAALPGRASAQSSRLDAAPAVKVSDDRFKWFFGAEAGAMFFQTQSQTQTGVPTVGAHLAVVARRAGLMVGVDEAFGSNEPSYFLDPITGDQVRPVTFDRIRRYGFNLTGYPMRGALEPYLGVGFGLLQVESPKLGGTFTSSEEAALSAQEANDRTAAAFMSFLAGVQFKVGRVAAFGQYQLSSAPSAGSLLRGSGHLLMGGLRFSLGSAKEEIRGGGY
jgi:hypothetical protein